MEDRLRKFAKVYEAKSFTSASKELHISQPALSVAIRKLERELSTRLFESRKPPLLLTKAGEASYRYAKELDARTDNLKLELARLTDKKPTLKIGMIDSIAQALLSRTRHLSELKEDVRLSLTIDNSRALTKAARQGDLHLALVANVPNAEYQNLRVTPLGDEQLLAVVSPAHARRVKEAVSNGVLPDFLDYDRASHTSQLIRKHFSVQNVELQTIFRSTSPEILLQLALAGEGAAVLPYLMVTKPLAHQTLTAISSPIARPIVALEQTDRMTAAPLAELCRYVRTLLEQF